VTVVSGTSITATTGAHATGAVNVVVTNPDGQSGNLSGGYTYASGTGTGNSNLGLGLAPGDSGSTTVAAGQTASYALSIGGAGMSGTASFSCTGAPTGADCSLPTSQPISSALPTIFPVKVTTTTRTVVAFHPPFSTPVSGCGR